MNRKELEEKRQELISEIDEIIFEKEKLSLNGNEGSIDYEMKCDALMYAQMDLDEINAQLKE